MKIQTISPFLAILLTMLIFTGCSKYNDDKLRPIITSTAPLDNEQGVARNASVTATFSMEIDPSTINANTFTLNQGATGIPGTVECIGVNATFTPLGTLGASTDYTVTISTDAKSVTGEALVSSHTWTFTTGGNQNGVSTVNLRTAGNFAILAKTAVINNPISAITGDIGLSPAATSHIVGFSLNGGVGYATSDQVVGYVYAADMSNSTLNILDTAVDNMLAAYNDVAGRSSYDFLELGSGSIGGLSLSPGVYKWTNSVTVSSDVTIYGNSTDVWIFQIAENLNVSSAAKVVLSGGAQAHNVFWQVAGQATFGTTSHVEGVILSKTGITFQAGASLNGRVLAQTAVVLDGNDITQR